LINEIASGDNCFSSNESKSGHCGRVTCIVCEGFPQAVDTSSSVNHIEGIKFDGCINDCFNDGAIVSSSVSDYKVNQGGDCDVCVDIDSIYIKPCLPAIDLLGVDDFVYKCNNGSDYFISDCDELFYYDNGFNEIF
jgi:hypothetical protein